MRDLLRLALVGTANSPLDPAAEPALEALLPLASRERRLLLLAGARAVHRAAGRRPATAALPAPAPDEERPESPRKLRTILSLAISGELEPLAPWIVDRLDRKGFRMPFEMLPSILERPKAATLWAPVLGERGAWLAQQNPDWRGLVPVVAGESDEENLELQWEEGDVAERLRALARMRLRDPAKARDWVAEALAGGKADQRAAMIACLAAGLSSDDEPLLEAQLADRSIAVRQQAGELLALLPDSAFAARMTARAAACLRWKPASRSHSALDSLAALLRKGGGARLVVEPPGELDREQLKEWERDGIASISGSGEGNRAFRLRQIVSLVPPRRWIEEARAPAADLLALVAGSDWSEALLPAFVRAAVRFRDAEWAHALLASGLPGIDAFEESRLLWAVLAPAARAEAVQTCLAAMRTAPARAGLVSMPSPWPEGLARSVVAALKHLGAPGLAEEQLALLQLAAVNADDAYAQGMVDALRSLIPSLSARTDWGAGALVRHAERSLALAQAKLMFLQETPP